MNWKCPVLSSARPSVEKNKVVHLHGELNYLYTVLLEDDDEHQEEA